MFKHICKPECIPYAINYASRFMRVLRNYVKRMMHNLLCKMYKKIVLSMITWSLFRH